MSTEAIKKINQPIVGYNLVDNNNKPSIKEEVVLDKMPSERDEILHGTTYKFKPPVEDGSAIYITINDVVINPGTEHEHKRPFEIFINSKNMDSFQWISAITRLISSVFRQGGDVTFLIEELKNVHQPNGGYYKRGGKYMPSIVAEIADIIEKHLISIGMIKSNKLDENQQKLIDSKKAEYLEKNKDETPTDDGYPKGATLCKSCNERAVIVMDGCSTCLNCANSKCS